MLKGVLSTGIVVMLLVVSGGAVKAETEGAKVYSKETYHNVHDENGVDCETCHRKPYRFKGWILSEGEAIGGPIVGRYLMPRNISREVDKVDCLECHRWGEDKARAFYGGESAKAGELYPEE